MPATCGSPVVQPRYVSALAALTAMLNPPAAFEFGVGFASWLAVTFHVESGTSAFGREASSSEIVHCDLRSPVAARTLATSAGATNAAEFPKLFRTNDATSATH